MMSVFSVVGLMPAARTIAVAQRRVMRSISRAFERIIATIIVASASGIVTTTTTKPVQIVRSIAANHKTGFLERSAPANECGLEPAAPASDQLLECMALQGKG